VVVVVVVVVVQLLVIVTAANKEVILLISKCYLFYFWLWITCSVNYRGTKVMQSAPPEVANSVGTPFFQSTGM
jgi:hypothetical protein